MTKENLAALKCVIHMAQYCYQITAETKYPLVDEIVAKYQERQLEIVVKMYNDLAQELEKMERQIKFSPKD